MSSAELPSKLADHPHSDKFVYKLLDEAGPMTVAGLRKAGYLADSTARLCLNRLEDAGLVETALGPDARVRYYDTTE